MKGTSKERVAQTSEVLHGNSLHARVLPVEIVLFVKNS